MPQLCKEVVEKAPTNRSLRPFIIWLVAAVALSRPWIPQSTANNSTYAGKLTSTFEFNSGLVILDTKNVCLIHDFDVVYAHFNLLQLQSAYTRWIAYLIDLTTLHLTNRTEPVGLFGWNDRSKRQAHPAETTSAAPVTPVTPSTTARPVVTTPGPTPLNDDLTEQVLLNSIEFELKRLRDVLVEIATKFQQIWTVSTDRVTPHFFKNFFLSGEKVIRTGTVVELHEFLLFEQVQQYQGLAKILKMPKRLLKVANQMTEFTETNEYSDFEYLVHAVEFIQERFMAFEEVADTLRENKLPSYLYDDSQLRIALTAISQRNKFLSVGQLHALIESSATTFPFKLACAENALTPDEKCPLYFATLLPVVKPSQVYKMQEVRTLPTYHQGILSNDWKMLQVPHDQVLVRDNEILPVKDRELSCIQTTTVSECDICILNSLSSGGPDKCISSIMQHEDPYDTCDTIKLDKVTDQSVVLSKDSIAYTDVNPGSIIEKCPGKETLRKSLEYTGIISFDKDCTYTVTNGPFQSTQVPSNVELLFNRHIHELDLSRDDSDSILGTHFDENRVYYFIGVSAAFGGTVIVFVCYCYLNKGRMRTGFRGISIPTPFSRRQRRREEVEIPLQSQLAPSVERALISLINV